MDSTRVPEDVLRDSRILIVDDMPMNVELFEQILRRDGYRNVSITTDPTEGLSSVASWDPHLILLDLRMPVLDGYTFMQRLLEADTPRPSILVITGEYMPMARDRAMDLAADDILVKPFRNAEMISRVRELLTAHHLRHLPPA